MLTYPIKDIFNLTFYVERPSPIKPNGQGGYIGKSWSPVDPEKEKRGALDDNCQNTQFNCEYALYCNGDVDVEVEDKVTLKLDHKQDKNLVFKVKAIKNPMMQYKYLVLFCVEDSDYK